MISNLPKDLALLTDEGKVVQNFKNLDQLGGIVFVMKGRPLIHKTMGYSHIPLFYASVYRDLVNLMRSLSDRSTPCAQTDEGVDINRQARGQSDVHMDRVPVHISVSCWNRTNARSGTK